MPGMASASFHHMKCRTRMIAGLFGLMAMTFSLAEMAWASTCPPDMAADAASVSVDLAPTDAPATAMPHGGDHGDREQGDRECPFGPIASAGCAGAAPLPTQAAKAPAPSPDGAAILFDSETRHDLLFGNTLFRPPRA